MGAVCASAGGQDPEAVAIRSQETKSNRSIDEAFDREKKLAEEVIKLLLLGTGESGKSTLFKQLVHLYGKGFSEEARRPYASIVSTNCILGMKTLIQKSDALTDRPELGTQMAASSAAAKRYLLELPADADINVETAQYMKVLWADAGIQNTFLHRNLFQLSDSIRYFMQNIDSIAKPNYLPSYTDMLHCRARTTGIVETTFQIESNVFRMVDVGGQRNERKKWIHCFEGVTAVIFVAALNEYDQVLYEDGSTNRLVEALELFRETCNSRWFRETNFLLFLNKRDLLEEKISRVPLKQYFPAYPGGSDPEVAVAWISEEFLKLNEYPDSATQRKIYVHVTCATDTSNINFTFMAVKDIIVTQRLKDCGLLE